MKKKIVAMVLTFSMLISSTSLSFAAINGGKQVKEVEAQRNATIVENAIGADDVAKNISKTKGHYIAGVDGLDIVIPKNGGNAINAELDTGEKISMNLPNEVADSEGILTENGTVVYDSSQENVTFLVQATENEVKAGEKESGVRTMVLIEDSTAPQDYAFKFELPKGSEFVRGSDLKSDEIDNDDIVIIDNEGFINGIIKAPWAKDANGKSLKTTYKLEGDVLVQHIEFDENTNFPVVADPWYGTSSQTENIGSPVEKNFTAYAAGQGTKGFEFKNGGYLSYTRGSGATANISFSLGAGYGAASLSVDIGFAAAESIGSVGASYPVPKVSGWYKLRVTEVHKVQTYKIMRRWKDSDTGRVTWKEFSRNAKVVGYVGLSGEPIKVA